MKTFELLNLKKEDEKYNYLSKVIETVLSCEDGKYIEEIYIKEGSIINGLLTNWVGVMIELNPEFVNKSLYDLIDDIEEECENFTLVISIEPNNSDRGYGTVIWKKGV